MTKWEYFVAYNYGDTNKWNFADSEGLAADEVLNRLGTSGFELVSVIQTGRAGVDVVAYFLKRPVR